MWNKIPLLMDMDTVKLKGKKALVTGAGGFIGSHLAEHLLSLGASVRAFVRYNSQNDWGWLEKSPHLKEIEVVSGDIRDYDSVESAVKGADIVFHLAALIGIPYSYASPLAYIRTNCEGAYNVLQSSLKHGTGKVIMTSTSEVYGTARYAPIDENHPLQPQSPYSATKIAADNLALSYYLSFGLPVVIARPFNTYGPRQSARAIIPTVITQILSGARQLKIGSLTPTRDLNFAGDTVSGFAHLAASDKCAGKTVNICSSEEISIGNLAALIMELMGADAELVTDEQRVRPEKSEVMRLLGDGALMKELTGWRPSTTLRQGLDQTVRWFSDKENLARYKPEIYNV